MLHLVCTQWISSLALNERRLLCKLYFCINPFRFDAFFDIYNCKKSPQKVFKKKEYLCNHYATHIFNNGRLPNKIKPGY